MGYEPFYKMKIRIELESNDLKLLINQLKLKCSYDDKRYPENVGHNSPRAHKLLEKLEKAKKAITLENDKIIDFKNENYE